jgi:hypothetical protein
MGWAKGNRVEEQRGRSGRRGLREEGLIRLEL